MITVESLVGKRVKFAIGSGEVSMSQASEEFILEQLEEAIYHKHFDFETWYNGGLESWERSEMKLDFQIKYLNKLLGDPSKLLNEYFIKEGQTFFLK